MELEGRAFKNSADLRIVSIDPIGMRDLFDITTGTGDFIANGVVSHNCFARPSHEYLDMGAGTDFDTKIVVKPHAAELLREAFDKPSWKGELVMFSGVTDCYQAVESQLELTKQCLQVCLEYRNPVAIITKSALIERDLDLIVELHKQAGVHLSMSIAWVDPKLARALEPWAPAPERRFKVIEKFAAAGVPVGVMCAPIMPGLNDDQMVRVLERAKSAGAQTAGWVLLRLPGAVATVFEERVREALPLAADKIMHLHPRDPRWREAVRPALAQARPRRGRVRADDRDDVRDDREAVGTQRRGRSLSTAAAVAVRAAGEAEGPAVAVLELHREDRRLRRRCRQRQTASTGLQRELGVLGEPRHRLLGIFDQAQALDEDEVAELDQLDIVRQHHDLAQQARRIDAVLEPEQRRAVRALAIDQAIEEVMTRRGE